MAKETLIPFLKQEIIYELLKDKNNYLGRQLSPFLFPGSVPACKKKEG